MFLRKGLAAVGMLLATVVHVHAQSPSRLDLEVIARAMSFSEGARRSTATIAIFHDRSDTRSREETEALTRLLGGGLQLGDIALSGVVVEQSERQSARSFDAVISVSGVDQQALAQFLDQSGTPCFTLETEQVSRGACTVAVRTTPTVSISLNSRNASASGVRFATAFIMMVREL